LASTQFWIPSLPRPRASTRRRALALKLLAPFVGVLAGFGGLTGCEEESAFGEGRAQVQGDPEPGTVVDFGTFVLEVDDVRDDRFRRAIIIRNTGNIVLQVRGIELRGDDAGEFVITERVNNLGAGNEDTIFVRFRPTIHQVAEAELVVTTNDRDDREISWTLRGDARDPCRLAMSPASTTFARGDVSPFEIRALTNSSCTVNFLDTDETLFQIREDITLPVTVEPDEPLVFNVEHDYFQPLLLPGVPVRQLRASAEHDQFQEVDLIGEEPIFGCLSVAPNNETLFPTTPVGTPRFETFSITNSCGEPVDIRGLRIGTGFEYFEVLDQDLVEGFTMAPFERVSFQVAFNATLPGISQGLLLVLTADTRNPQFRRELTGQAISPEIDVFPEVLDFGTVTFRNPIGVPPRSECSSPSREVRLFPVGQARVTIESIEVEAESDDLFIINSVTVNGQPVFDLSQPFVVPPGGDGLRIGLRFFPTRLDPSLHEGTLRIEHNARGGESLIRLVGDAAPNVPVQESFQQAEGPKVDILWVIDNSCSMSDEQQRLVANLGDFTEFADEQDADYQMGVTVTDGFSSDSGRLERCFPHPAVISGDYPQRQEAFDCTFLVGTDGSGVEAGFAAAKNALDLAIDEEPNGNTGFLRDDADLAVVFMSDEDDQSGNAEALQAFFESVKGPGRASRTKLHAIAGPTTGPCGDGSGFFNAQPGFRYQALANNTGGLFFDICQADWSPIFDQLGLDTFQAFDTWFLSQPAAPSTLQVFVDGVPVPEDPVNGYVYQFQENAVQLNGTSVPGPGARIEIRYSNQCTP